MHAFISIRYKRINKIRENNIATKILEHKATAFFFLILPTFLRKEIKPI